MQEKRGIWITNREAAQIRLAQWAGVLRAMYMRGAPNVNYYNQQPFVNGKIDHDALRRFIEQDERFDMALETDEWLVDLRVFAKPAYQAVVIRYVERVSSTPRVSRGEARIRLWTERTGLKRRQYYERLNEAERYVGLLLGVAAGF